MNENQKYWNRKMPLKTPILPMDMKILKIVLKLETIGPVWTEYEYGIEMN